MISFRRAAVCLLALASAALAPAATSPVQPPGNQTRIEGAGNKYARYYPAPHQSQMQALIEGGKTQPQPDGRILITDARMQTFTTLGKRELEVRAPQCSYSPREGTMSDPGAFAGSFSEGGFTLEGRGFSLLITNLSLTVSNQVHSHIRGELLSQAAPAAATAESAPARDLDVYSDHFNYATNTGLGTYLDHVRASGTNLSLASKLLEVFVPVHEGHMERVSARGAVKVDTSGLQAAGDEAVYTISNDVVRLTGDPSWHAAEREGRGDELILERTNGVLHANGNAELFTLANGAGGFHFMQPAPGAAARTNREIEAIEIHSAQYLLRTNYAWFSGNVRAAECAGTNIGGTLTCGELTMSGAGSNTTATAVQNVDFRQTDPATGEHRHFAGDKAVYHGTTGEMELTGTPIWSSGDSSGNGDLIQVTSRPEGMIVRGKAFLRVPADQLAAPPSMGSAAAAPAPATPRAPAAPVNFAEVYSTEYRLAPGGADFAGPVRLHHPEMIWKTGRMIVESPKNSRSRRLIGEDGVEFDFLDNKGATHHGTGATADMISGMEIEPAWTNGAASAFLTPGATNQILVLTGDPALLTDDTGNVRNRLIIMDGIRHRITTPGRYFMWGKGPPMGTNRFDLPTGQPRKKGAGPASPAR